MAGNKLRAVTRKITPDRKKYYRQIIYPEIPLDVNIKSGNNWEEAH